MRTWIILFLMISRFVVCANAQNFVSTDRADLSRYIDRAEQDRRRLAEYWIGERLPNWSKPCVLTVRRSPATSGRTTFVFDDGEVYGWKMQVNGPTQTEVCDSVIPHEVNHTIFASVCRRPLPRWFDEGASMFCECGREHERQRAQVASFVETRRFVPVSDLFASGGEYGRDSRVLTAQYCEGFSLVEYLVAKHGREQLIEFAKSGADANALRTVYRIDGPDDLERRWYSWFRTHQANGFGCSIWGCPAPHQIRPTKPTRSTPLIGETAPVAPKIDPPKPDNSKQIAELKQRIAKLESTEIPVQLIDAKTGSVMSEKRYPIGQPIKLIFQQVTIERQ